MDEFDKLASRVEALTGADREVDVAIHHAIGLPRAEIVTERTVDGVQVGWGVIPKRYTHSTDAALRLVPEGWQITTWGEWEDAILRERGPWLCIVAPRGYRGPLNPCWDTRCDHAATPALALTAAALRARAQQRRDGEG